MQSGQILAKLHDDVQSVLNLLGGKDSPELRIFLLHVEFAVRRLNPSATQRLDVAALRGMREVVRSLNDLVLGTTSKKHLWGAMPEDKWKRRPWKEKHCMCEAKAQLQLQIQAMMTDLQVGADPELRAALEYLTQARLVEEDALGKEEWKVDTKELELSEVYLRGMGRGWSGITAAGNYCGTQVAVKMPHGDQAQLLAANPERVAAFEEEVALLFRLHHPNVVTCFGGIGAEDSGKHLFYVVNEILSVTLTEEISRPDTPLRRSREERCRLCWETCRGMLYMHSLQPEPFLHRDLNTITIMLDAHRVVKVIDFGATREETPAASAATLLLREDWVAPEVQSGAAGVSLASDRYALALCCFCVCTVAPLGKYSPVQSSMSRMQEAMAKTGLPASLVEAVLRGILLPPDQRPSAAELAIVLEETRERVLMEAVGSMPGGGGGGSGARSPVAGIDPNRGAAMFRRTQSVGGQHWGALAESEEARGSPRERMLREKVEEVQREVQREREGRERAEAALRGAREEAERERREREKAEGLLAAESEKRAEAEVRAVAAEGEREEAREEAELARQREREASEQLRQMQEEAGVGLQALRQQLAGLEERARAADGEREGEEARGAAAKEEEAAAGQQQEEELVRLRGEVERLKRERRERREGGAAGGRERERGWGGAAEEMGSFRSVGSSGSSASASVRGERWGEASQSSSFRSARGDSPLAVPRGSQKGSSGEARERELGGSFRERERDRETSPRTGSGSGRFVAVPPPAAQRLKPRAKGSPQS